METSVAALISRMAHWAALSLGSEWTRAAQALVDHDTASASKAFIWARLCFMQYQVEWETNPGSRWDPDAMDFVQDVDTRLVQLYANPAVVDAAFPPWVDQLLGGMVPTALPDPSGVAPFLADLAALAIRFGGEANGTAGKA